MAKLAPGWHDNRMVKSLMLAAIFFLCGCTQQAGRDFARPGQIGVVLGQTTEPEVERLYGVPASRQGDSRDMAMYGKPGPFDRAAVPGSLTYLQYSFLQMEAPVSGGALNRKGATFSFWDGVLVGSDFNSSFAADSSDFDDAAARALLVGRPVTRAQVVAQFGEPGGRYVYPLTPAAGVERLHYSYQQFDVPSKTRRLKVMDVMVDAAGRVLNHRIGVTTTPFEIERPQPVVRGGGFIFLPTVRSGGRR